MRSISNKHTLAVAVSRGALYASLCLGGVLASATLAAAQEAAPPVSDASTEAQDQPSTVDEIIVTGQRRSERLQDVPASITAVTAETLQNSGFRNVADIQYLAPTVTFNPVQGAGFQIRGVGSQSFDYNLEKSVSTVLDDVVQGLPRSTGVNTLADIERVEVLRGPQGTLFGKNASAGVVYIVTRRPKLGETEILGRLRYGTDNEYTVENTLNLPVGEDLAFRLTGVVQHRDGFLTNAVDGEKEAAYTDRALKFKTLWEPAGTGLSAYLIADYQEHSDTGLGLTETLRTYSATPATSTQVNFPALLGVYGITPGAENETFASNMQNFNHSRSNNVTATLNYAVGAFTLTSVTAYKTLKINQELDADNSQGSFFDINFAPRLDGSQFSQEIRLSSPIGGFVDYVVGAYYYDQSLTAIETQGGLQGRTDLLPGQILSPVGGDAVYGAASKSLAAFGQGNVHLTDKLTAVVGGRFTHDEVRGTFRVQANPDYNFVGAILPAAGSSQTDENFSGRLSLQYEPSETLMLYATASQGYKAPAVGTSRGVIRDVKAETVTNYEAGFKSQMFDRRLTFNAGLFYDEFENFQTQTFVNNPDGSVSFLLDNAGGLKTYGLELDFRVRATDDLVFSGGAAYAPSEYTEFRTSCYPLQTLNAAPGPGCYIQPGTTSRVFDAKGQDLTFAPKTTFNVAADYNHAIGNGLELFASATYAWRSSVYTITGNPFTVVDSYGLLNGTLGVANAEGRWKFGLYARNLFDEHFVSRIRPTNYSPVGTYSQVPAAEARRTLGVSLDYAF